ncbi:hypothetical protein FOZ63_014848 [Perkinsus olseni]|uniref:Uncharacterized protein n=1 Tax=Perkinsus olseni TaxID=32597 RepID=A0A7J6Q8L7_PEROL|nr:hypothetical protein FOZ63_014848 [Perkinsus olseni]KAF4717698.1 hypothetical protein FOZ62_000264 [Perkinsus olseni]
MILIFDEMGEVVFSSMDGGTEEIQYVRYYPVGFKPGALLTVAYTTGGPAHFLALRDSQNRRIIVENSFYDVNTIDRWDDVGAAMGVMARERSTLPTARLRPGGVRPPGRASRGPATAQEWFSLHRGRDWLFGLGTQDDEYFIAPLRPLRDTKNATAYEKPPSQATILHIDSEGATHYYEAFVDSFNETQWCVFGIQEREYPLSDGHLEKPLKYRILSMDHPVTEELNDLCANRSLYIRTSLHPTNLDDWEPETGNYTGSVGNETLTVEVKAEGLKALQPAQGSFDHFLEPIMHNQIGFLQSSKLGEREARVVLLRLPGTTMEAHSNSVNTGKLKSFTKGDFMGWDTIKA